MTEILRFALVSFYFLFFKSSETLSALLSQNPSPSYSRLMRIILWRKQFSGLLFFSISRLCGLVPGLVWLGQNWNGLNVWACSGNGVHGGFRKGWLWPWHLHSYYFLSHSLPPPFPERHRCFLLLLFLLCERLCLCTLRWRCEGIFVSQVSAQLSLSQRTWVCL